MWLQFDQVAVGYGGRTAVLAQVDFRIGNGLWMVTGPNGSGKSSLIRTAASIIRPLGGCIRYGGEDIWQAPARFRWHLGYVPQEVEEFPALRASAYLEYLAGLKGVQPALKRDRAMSMLHLLGVENRLPSTFSTGIKRRLALAGALLNDPDLLILDEPTAALDLSEKVWLRTFLSDLARERIILLTTHVPEELEMVSDGWLQIRDGSVNFLED